MKSFRFLSSALLVAALVLPGTAAHADPASSIDLNDPTSTMSKVAPEHVTSTSGPVSVTPNSKQLRTPQGETLRVTDLTNKNPTTVAVTPSQSHAGKVGEYEVYKSVGVNSTTYVKPTPAGAQIIFGAQSIQNLQDFAISFTDGIARQLPMPDGSIVLDFWSGTTIKVEKPWAKDAEGNTLQTSYVVNGNSIKQEVTTDASTKFPVVADPGWSYIVKYDLSNKVSVKSIMDSLHDCFNCKFPVENAPRNFPKPGDFLPLTASIGPLSYNFNCTFTYEGTGTSGDPAAANPYTWMYMFNSTKDHVDGLGSSISFMFAPKRDGDHDDPNGNIALMVSANIVKEDPLGPPWGQTAYKAGALSMWSNFAANVRGYRGTHGEGVPAYEYSEQPWDCVVGCVS